MNVIDNSHMEAILNYVADKPAAKLEIWHNNDGRELAWYASIKYMSKDDITYGIPWDELAQPGYETAAITYGDVLKKLSTWVGQQIK